MNRLANFTRFLTLTAQVGIFCAILMPLTSLAQDIVDVKNSRSLRGTITAMTPDYIEVDGTKKVEVDRISRVSYESEPSELRTVRRSVIEGRFNRIIENLDKITNPPNRKEIKLDMQFYRALALSKLALSGESGTIKAAATAMGNFVKNPQAPTNYHYYQALEVFGDLAMAAGNAQFAEKQYALITKAQPKSIKLDGLLKLASAQISQGKHKEAFESYSSSGKIDTPDQESTRKKMFAEIGKATCLAELGRVEEGIKTITELIKTEDAADLTLFGKANNALGRCHMKNGDTKEALFAFLKTDTLFFADPNTHAEALYYLVGLHTKVGKNDRAVAARKTLKTRYQNTVWASKK